MLMKNKITNPFKNICKLGRLILLLGVAYTSTNKLLYQFTQTNTYSLPPLIIDEALASCDDAPRTECPNSTIPPIAGAAAGLDPANEAQPEGDSNCLLTIAPHIYALTPLALMDNGGGSSFVPHAEIAEGYALYTSRVNFGNSGKKGRFCFLNYLKSARTLAAANFGLDIQEFGIQRNGRAATGHETVVGYFHPSQIPGTRESSTLYPGADSFRECQRIDTKSGTNYKDIVIANYSSGGADGNGVPFIEAWNKLTKEFIEAITHPRISTSGDREDMQDKLGSYRSVILSYNTKARDLFVQTRRCIAARYLVSAFTDFRNNEQLRKPPETKSFDGKISCTSSGPETQDFWACKSMVNAYNAAEIGGKGVEVIQEIDFMNKTSEIQTDMTLNQQTDATAALKAQRDTVRANADKTKVAGVVDAAKAAVLAAKINEMPSLDEVISKCKSKLTDTNSRSAQSQNYEKFINLLKFHAFVFDAARIVPIGGGGSGNGEDVGAGNTGNNLDLSSAFSSPLTLDITQVDNSSDLCQYTASNFSLNLIMNEKAKDTARGIMIAAGFSALAKEAQGVILDNQADRIDDAISGVKKFKPDIPTIGTEDLLIAKCQADPSAADCDKFGFNQDIGFAGSNINMGGIQQGTDGTSSTAPTTDDGQNAIGSGGTDRSNAVARIGSAVTGINKGGGFAGRIPGAAGIKVGDTSGGGGGGGTASSVAAPGGGGGGPGGGGAPGGKGGGPVGKLSYAGGGAKLNYVGGTGNSRAKSGGDDNPFAKMFKKGQGASGTKVVDFGRNPASLGNKNGNIFGMISNRYQAVNGSKRLLEYENKDKK